MSHHQGDQLGLLHRILMVKHLLVMCCQLQVRSIMDNAEALGDTLLPQLEAVNVEAIFTTEPQPQALVIKHHRSL